MFGWVLIDPPKPLFGGKTIMKLISTALALLFAIGSVSGHSNAEGEQPVITGPYLGQTPPGTTPQVFAPGLIATPGWEYGVFFAPGMKELYWLREVTTDTEAQQQFVMFQEENGIWHERVLGDRRGTPTLSTDGTLMFFGRSYKELTKDGWSEPKRLGPAFEDIRIMRVTASNGGTIVIDEAKTDSVLRYARRENGEWSSPQPLPKEINTGEWNAHPFIAPDESYIIWDGQRDSDVRNADLFISFKDANGKWGEAIKFDDTINTSASEFAAFVTPDGQYLFFNRNMGPDNPDPHWVSAQVIEDLRPKLEAN